jgi:LmbE family N-acetylglucosaminyl deacetylase
VADAKFAMASPRTIVLWLVQEIDRVPPVAITLHVHKRGYRHIRAG